MLEKIAERTKIAELLGTTLADMPMFVRNRLHQTRLGELSARQRHLVMTTRWEQWRYRAFWAARVRAAAQRSQRLIAPSSYPQDVSETFAWDRIAAQFEQRYADVQTSET